MLSEAKVRDYMVHVARSATESIQNATWTVFDDTQDLRQYRYRFDGIMDIHPVSAAMCGYEISVYDTERKVQVFVHLMSCVTETEKGKRTAIIIMADRSEKIVFFNEYGEEYMQECAKVIVDTVKEYALESSMPSWDIKMLSSSRGIYTIQVHARTLVEAFEKVRSETKDSDGQKMDVYGTAVAYGRLADCYLSGEICSMHGYERLFPELEDIYCIRSQDLFAVVG